MEDGDTLMLFFFWGGVRKIKFTNIKQITTNVNAPSTKIKIMRISTMLIYFLIIFVKVILLKLYNKPESFKSLY